MKIFCAYAFTGEDLVSVKKRMRLVVDTLDSSGHEAYCNLDDPLIDAIKEKDDVKAIFDRAFEVLKTKEVLIAIITSSNKSVGQIMEIGAAYSQGKPIYVFEHESAIGSSCLSKLSTKAYTWNTLNDLEAQLKLI